MVGAHPHVGGQAGSAPGGCERGDHLLCRAGKTRDADPVVSDFSFSDQSWSLRAGRPAMPGVVVYARIDGGFSVWDPARNYWRQAPSVGVNDHERPPAYHFDNRSVWEGLTVGDRRACEGLIRDWVGWQKARDPEFAMLEQALKTLSVPEEPLEVGPPIRVELGEGFDTPTIKTPYDLVPITHASAGVRRVAALAYLLVWAWREHVLAARLLRQDPERRIVLLVDEPETHLHPKWQRVILPALLRVVGTLREDGEMQTQLITATHAPLVLASSLGCNRPALAKRSGRSKQQKHSCAATTGRALTASGRRRPSTRSSGNSYLVTTRSGLGGSCSLAWLRMMR